MTPNEHFEKYLLPRLKEVDMVVVLVPDGIDMKYCVEVGASVLLGKPIVAVVRPGVQISESLSKIVHRFVEWDGSSNIEQTLKSVSEAARQIHAEQRESQS